MKKSVKLHFAVSLIAIMTVLAVVSCGKGASNPASGAGANAGTGSPGSAPAVAEPAAGTEQTPQAGSGTSTPAAPAPAAPAGSPAVSAAPTAPVSPGTPVSAAPAPQPQTPVAPAVPAGVDYAKFKEVAVPAPKPSPASGVYPKGQTVAVTCALKEALIKYTLDGSNPSPTAGLDYAGPVKLAATATFKAIAYIPGGRASTVAAVDYAVGEVFVKAGAAGGIGTRSSPLGTVAAGLAAAWAKGCDTVKVAAGDYAERIDIAKPVTVRGGYRADFAAQNAVTTIRGLEVPGATQNAPGYAVKIAGADARVVLERLTIAGGDANYSTAVLVADQGAPVLRDCVLAGGTGSYTYGLRTMNRAAPRLERCSVDGGDGGSTFGVSADSGTVVCVSSTIRAGSGTVVSYGFSLTGAKAQVSGCVVDGGAANASYGVALYSAYGVSLAGDTISGGTGKIAYAVFIASCDPEIRNCVLVCRGSSKSYGVYENYGDSDPKVLEANCFLDSDSGDYYDEDTKKSFTAADANGQLVAADGTLMATPRGLKNAVETAALDGPPEFRMKDAPQSVRGGGVPYPAGLDLDRDGKKRTAPYSMGAYELD